MAGRIGMDEGARDVTGVPVVVDEECGTPQMRELSVSITQARVSGDCSKGVMVKLFCEEELPFLYLTELTAQDFAELKKQQQLIFDFAHFPCKLLELLEKCIEWSANDVPRFQAMLTVQGTESAFRIVQTDEFRKLPVLELSLRQGTEMAAKQFLFARLKEFKRQIHYVSSDLLRSKEEATLLRHDLDAVRQELATMRNDQLDHDLGGQVDDKGWRGILQGESVEVIERIEREKTDMEHQMQQELEEVTAAKNALDKENRKLVEEKRTMDVQVSELSQRLAATESTLASVHGQKTNEKHELKEELEKYKRQVCTLEQQVASLEESKEQLKSECDDLRQSAARAEKQCKTLEEKNEESQGITQHLAGEVQDVRMKIQKKHAQVETLTEQLRQRIKAEAEQQRRVAELDAELEKALRQNSELQSQLRNCTSGYGAMESNTSHSVQKPLGMHPYVGHVQRRSPMSPVAHSGSTPELGQSNIRIQGGGSTTSITSAGLGDSYGQRRSQAQLGSVFGQQHRPYH